MRVLMLSKACIVGIYQRKLEEIARLGVDLLVLVPPSWKDERGEMKLERAYTDGYRLKVVPIRLNGNFHLHYYPGLSRAMRRFKPDIVHIDEEPYNLSAWQALRDARRVGARSLFFSWQNIARDYPPPFEQGERWMINRVDYAIAGTDSAAAVWRLKGYRGPLAVIPQFGVDPVLFAPRDTAPINRPFTIGYFGRLVEEKGIGVLFNALQKLRGNWRLIIMGGGPLRSSLEGRATALGIADRVRFRDAVASTDMPDAYHELDVLILPSLTRPNWKEQFGRVLVEAMASGVPVIGSNSGAIPGVIGDAGLIFPEGDSAALNQLLVSLQIQPTLRHDLARKGRQRALDHFTHAQIAAETVAVYEEIMHSSTDNRAPRTE